MKKITLTIMVLISINHFCFAQEENIIEEKPKEYEVGIHIHPFWSVFSLWTFLSECYIYTTFEIPNPYNTATSFIIRPSLWNSDLMAYHNSSEKWFRLGTDIGIRYYPNNKGKGFYLQGTAGLFFFGKVKILITMEI